jgi:dsDNA-binding SOS-regulon protein
MSDTPTTLQRLKELKELWHQQNFAYTLEQRQAYDILLARRRERVSELYKEGRVWSGPSEAGKPIEE